MKNAYSKPIIVAEAGCNHQGKLNLALKLIEKASEAGANYIKFQKRNNTFLLGKNYNKPHPVRFNSFGKSYGLHRDFLELDIKEHVKLYKYCKKKNIKYALSVWDVKSAEEVLNSSINLDYIKVPSGCNLDKDLIYYLCKNFKKKIHLSLGMTTKKEINIIVNYFKKMKRNKDLVLYSCTSTYPCKFKDLCLLEINKLKKNYGRLIDSIAFSGHHLGIAADIGAYTLGAKIIERHFTLDRTMKGTDHAASLEPLGLRLLIRNLISVYKSLNYKKKLIIEEKKMSKKLRFKKNLN